MQVASSNDPEAQSKWYLKYLKVRKLEDIPQGYYRLAAFISSDQNLLIFRGFATIHARLLLHLQTEIQRLEKELNRMDEMETDELRLKSGAQDARLSRKEKKANKDKRTRCDVLEDLRIKICQYDEIMINQNAINGFQRESNRDYSNVRAWIENNTPLVSAEEEYILCKDDLWSMRRGREGTVFEGAIGNVLKKCESTPLRGIVRWIFCSKEVDGKTSDSSIHYFSPSRITKTADVPIAITSVLFLVAPILAMYELSTRKTKRATYGAIGVLVGFSMLFAGTMAIITQAKRHEVFAASAAYCAVLVVFIGSTTQ
ncbi:hypothetical protein E8E11_002378 [Didymella keratinophila]|nr:hypothetical protein E8E11_002378 [Didymella keratinophila]